MNWNKLDLRALALVATGLSPLATASGNDDWTELEEDLRSLYAAPATQAGGVDVGALIRSSFDMSGDDIFAVGGGSEDLQGWRAQDILFWLEGDVEDMHWRVSIDFADSVGIPGTISDDGIHDATLLDAYARWAFADQLHLYWGQFKCPVLRSSLVAAGDLLFIDRTRLGQFFDVWQPGTALTFDHEEFHAKLAVQNGADGIADDYGVVARGEYKLNGGAPGNEGALGAPEDELTGTLGAAFFTDTDENAAGDDFGSAFAIDAAAAYERFSLFVEAADMDDELAMKTVNAEEGLLEDGVPWSFTVAYVLSPDEWEVALRHQDLDDGDDTSITGVGLNWYTSGHDAKWQLNVSEYDDEFDDGLLVQLGLTIGTNGK